MDIHFSLWVIIHYYPYFVAQIIPDLEGAYSSWSPSLLNIFTSFVDHFLNFWCYKYSRHILHFPCSKYGISHFSQGPSSFSWGVALRNQNLGTKLQFGQGFVGKVYYYSMCHQLGWMSSINRCHILKLTNLFIYSNLLFVSVFSFSIVLFI